MRSQGRSLRPRLVLVSLALACALGCRGAPAVRANASPLPRPGGAPEIEALCRAQQDAWNRGDLESFMALGYWHDSALTFFSGGESTRGYEPMLERYRRRYQTGGNEMGQLLFSELESAHLGEQDAIVRGHWALAFSGGTSVGGLFTLLLRRFPEGWRIVHDHTSVASS